MAKLNIPCGGFFVDGELFYFEKDEVTGQPILRASEDAIRGVQGPKGDKGDPFSISKIYSTIEEMEDDFDNPDVALDAFAIIENEVHTEDNGKLYIKGEEEFLYVTDLSTGTMIEGPQGNPGVGVPSGGTDGQILFKSSDEDYATHWDDLDLSAYATVAELGDYALVSDLDDYATIVSLEDYPKTTDIADNLLPTVTEEEDNGKVAQVIGGIWTMSNIEFGEVVHAATSVIINGDTIPTLTEAQVTSAYNSFIAGKSVAVSSVDGKRYFGVVGVDASDAEDIHLIMLYADKFIITYNHLGQVYSFKDILQGQVVTLSREYGTSPNDYGFYREWSPNAQGKVWVECGVFITTVALSVGSRVPLPVTFEDSNFHVQVTVMAMGNYSAKAYRGSDNSSINVVVTDYYGTAVQCPICVEAKGWKAVS